MSGACRHCSNEIFNLLDDTYISILCHSNNRKLEADLQDLEKVMGVIPGITVWCEKCMQVGIISYDAYTKGLNNISYAHNIPLMLPTEYYSKMYKFATFLGNV
jgi:hypothetical protein